MTRKHTLLWTATTAAASALLIGWLVLQPGDAGQPAGEHPNNKANHHPRSTGDGSTN
jgi:hypothetical protein